MKFSNGDVPGFWEKADVGGADECWPWLASRFAGGYGQFRRPYLSSALAHRIAYELVCGPIGEGAQIDHLCRNRACVNPAHMEVVTPQEHGRRSSIQAMPFIMARYAAIAASPHWKCGHDRNPDNTIKMGGGKRACRICNARRCLEYYRTKRSA